MRLDVCLLVGVTCCVSSVTDGAAQTGSPVLKLSEREAMERLMTRDPRIRALSARVDEVRAQQRERALYPNPTATFSREHVFETSDLFLVARQELPISGRRRSLHAAGRSAVEVASADVRMQTVDLQSALRDAYTDLLSAQQREAVLRSGIDRFEKLIATLRLREQAGEGSRYDRLRGERALADLQADLALATGLRAQAQGALAAFLGPDVSPDSIVAADSLDAPAAPQPVPTLIALALDNRGDYRARQLSIDQFEAERRAAMELRTPTPTLTGGLKQSTTSGARSSGYQFSLDVALPLFSRGQAATSLAIAQKSRAEVETESFRLRIEAEVHALHALLTIHRERTARYRESVAEIAEPLASTGRVGYEEGELGILELLDAERQAVDAQLRVIELTAAARHAAIDLDRAIGLE